MGKKIKIIHVITGLSTGGAEMMLYKLLSNYDKSLFEPVVISLTDKGTIGKSIRELVIPVYTIGIIRGYFIPIAAYQFIRLIIQLKPDIIQGWMYHGNIAASFAGLCLLNKIPIIWNIRHTPYDLQKEKRFTSILVKLGAYLAQQPRYIIYNSQASLEQHRLLGYGKGIPKIIPNGFDCDKFKPSATARLALRKELKLAKEDLLIGFIARYHPMKNHIGFIRAASKLIKKYLNVHFVLAGRNVDRHNLELVNIIAKENIGKQIHLLGERNDIAEITAAFDITTNFSSWGESFSNAIGEAMACGVPCVVTNIGDSGIIVGDTGITIVPNNKEELVKAWEKLIAIGSKERKKLGKRARERIVNNYSLSNVINKYEDLYKEVLKNP